MKKVIDYETELEGIEFGFFPGEGEPDEGVIQSVEPDTPFERAVVDTIEGLKYAMREELIALAKRFEALEEK